MVAGFSVINIVAILSYKRIIEESLLREAALHKSLIAIVKSYQIPEYIKITDKELEEFSKIGVTDGKFILVKNSYILDKTVRFGILLFVWEIALVVSLNYILYITIVRYIKRREEFERLLGAIVLSISHKIGNFLSSQRINLQILKDTNNPAVDRLFSAYSFMERDFKRLTKTLRELSFIEESKEKVDIMELIGDIVGQLESLGNKRKIILSGRNVSVNYNRIKLENILFPVIENAFFYSKDFVHIKVCLREGVSVVVRNDIGKLSGGSGVGEALAKYLLETEGGEFKKKFGEKYYTVVIKLS